MHASRDELAAARQHWQETKAEPATASKAAQVPELSQEIDWTAELQAMQEALQLALDVALATALTQVAKHAHALKVPVAWDVYDVQAADLAKKYRYDLIKDLNDSTRTMLGGTVGKWIESDEDFDQLVQRTRAIVPADGRPGLRDRAQLVSATEVTRVYADSRMAGMQAAGLKQVRWTTANDEIVCPICGALGKAYHGQGAIGDTASRRFLNPANGQYYEMPGHPGCRCWARESEAELQALVSAYADMPEGTPPDVMGFTWWKGELPTAGDARAEGEAATGWADHRPIVKADLRDHGARLPSDAALENTIGLWGAPEPSFNARVIGPRDNVIQFACDWGAKYKQDSVLTLMPNPEGTGGVLSWDFSRATRDDEWDRLLKYIEEQNQLEIQLAAQEHRTADYFGLTLKGDRRVEYWASSDAQQLRARQMLEQAMRNASLEVPVYEWEGGYDWIMLEKGKDYFVAE